MIALSTARFLVFGYAACVALASCAGTPQVRGSTPDIGPTFGDLNEAAKAGCQWIWDHEPNARKWEYCGALYRDADGIRVGAPITWQGGRCGSPSGPPFAPEGTRLLGKYHSHRFEPQPSAPDLWNASQYPELGHFLCSPSGIVRRFSAEGTVMVK
jgi:hypothetical protein